MENRGRCPHPRFNRYRALPICEKGDKTVKSAAINRIKLTTRVGLLLSIALIGRNSSVAAQNAIYTA